MKPWIKILVPIGLFAAAAAINTIVITQQLAEQPYVIVRRQIVAGERFDPSALDLVSLPGDPERLRGTLIPGEDRDVILGMVSRRDLHPGDPVFWRDLKKPSTTVELSPDELMLPVDLNGVPVETSLLFPGCRLDFCVAPAPADVRRAPHGPADAEGAEPEGYQLIGPFRVLTVGRDATRAAAGAASLTLAFDNEARPGSRGNERLISVAVRVQADGKYDRSARRLLEALAARRITAIVLRAGG